MRSTLQPGSDPNLGHPAPRPLDLLAAPLRDTALVEASAGTGKTYTITGLLLRLICEGRVAIDQVLVVTYTVAATAELRDRIRCGLLDATAAFESGASSEQLLQDMLAHYGAERELVLLRLAAAVADFDAVAIYTIHGFCQRALADYAFEGGMPFALDMLLDDGELLEQIVRDFWRLQVYAAPPVLVDALRARGETPTTLARWVRQYVEKPFLRVQAPPDVSLDAVQRAFDQAYLEARRLWRAQRDNIAQRLLGNPDFNGRRYRRDWLSGWLRQMDDYLAAEQGRPGGFDKLDRLGAASLAAGMKKGKRPPEHPFFAACDRLDTARQALLDGLDRAWRTLLLRLLHYCDEQLRLRKQRAQQQSFGDLLLRLCTALQGSDGPLLAAALRQRYQAALIDEFQDTDPIQYRIFQCIYQHSGLPVYLVGDPKQAIYSFRGADVFTYLDGRADAQHHFTLRDNWRSTPAMINAVNGLFAANPRPFWFARIPFEPATPAPKAHAPLLLRGHSDDAPFKIWLLGTKAGAGSAAGKCHTKTEAGELATEATASEIVKLLNLSAAGQARLGGRALDGGDIAVLVRSHAQAMQVRAALARRGVASVEQSPDSVLQAPEAEQLEHLLAALVEPASGRRIRAALVTPLFGLGATDLVALDQDERRWEAWLDDFLDWHELWRRRGFMVAVRQLMETHHVAQHLLRFDDGHRRLTNLRHLLELLQARSHTHHGMEALLQWLSEQRLSGGQSSEAAQLRLENDEQLVHIVTIHKSKGLQYPVVFCPFAWHGKLWSESADTYAIHDPTDAYRPHLDLCGDEAAAQLARQEELAENLRLLYVALTRAEHRCYLAWGTISQAGKSALAWLLHAAADPDSVDLVAFAKAVDGLSEQDLRERLGQLAAQTDGAIEVLGLAEQIEQTRYRAAGELPELGGARAYSGRCRAPWRVTSYTALSSHSGGAPSSLPDAGEPRDYDAGAPSEVAPADPVQAAAAPALRAAASIHTFPRGARAGHCLHAIFERIDFPAAQHLAANPDVAPAGDDAVVARVDEALRGFGFEPHWRPVLLQMLGDVVTRRLDRDPGPRLAEVGFEQRISELEFQFPLGSISAAGLQRAVASFDRAAALLAGLSFARVQGFMKGFIDLVFQAGERFYIVDYKSNWLGPTPAAYHVDALAEAMQRGDYHWQYLIYCVALQRYLRYRLPDYAYQRHFGGVYYLFVRGMQGDADTGVYRALPEPALVAALDRYFADGDDL